MRTLAALALIMIFLMAASVSQAAVPDGIHFALGTGAASPSRPADAPDMQAAPASGLAVHAGAMRFVPQALPGPARPKISGPVLLGLGAALIVGGSILYSTTHHFWTKVLAGSLVLGGGLAIYKGIEVLITSRRDGWQVRGGIGFGRDGSLRAGLRGAF